MARDIEILHGLFYEFLWYTFKNFAVLFTNFRGVIYEFCGKKDGVKLKKTSSK